MSNTCSACGIGMGTVYIHPMLGVPICSDCNEGYHTGEFTVEDSNEIYCRWCGEGDGELLLCDSCPKSFCSRCIGRNFGPVEVTKIKNLSNRWNCLVCSPLSFHDLCVKKGWKRKDFGKSTGKSKYTSKVTCPDISLAREKFEIPAVNDVDDEVAPQEFMYVNQQVLARPVNEAGIVLKNPDYLSCCSCQDGCRDPATCECLRKMGGAAYGDDQILFRDSTFGVFECSSRCACHINECTNRVVQHGPNLRLEVFRCQDKNMGWGVRCKDEIPAGSYVADYIGEIMSEEDVETRGLLSSDQYLYNFDYFGRDQASRHQTSLGLRKDLTMFGANRGHDVPGGQTVRERLSRDLDRIESNINVTCMTREDLLRHLDRDLVDKLQSSGAIDRALGHGKRLREEPAEHLDELDKSFNQEVPSGGFARKEKPRKGKILKHRHGNAPPDGHATSSSDSSDIAATRGNSNNIAVSSERSHDSWAENHLKFRLKVREKARDILTDRVVLETEEKHDAYVIDAKWYGSVARFFNHSCSPNLEVISVFCGDTQDPRLPRVALFANSNIPAFTELTYDYSYKPGNVQGKNRDCLCGAQGCRKLMY